MAADKSVPGLTRAFADLGLRLVREATHSRMVLRKLAPPFTNMSRANWLRALTLWRALGADLVRQQAPRNCPACGSQSSRPLFTSYDGYPFVDCLSCGCWYVPLVVDATLYERFFERSPEARTLGRVMTADRLEASRAAYDRGHFGEEIDELLTLARDAGLAPRSLLDVGCGVGHGLFAARQRGLTAVGVEADPDCVELGEQQDLDIRLASNGTPRGPFDLVGIWETLEHVNDPLGLLKALKTSLADGAIISILVPSLASPSVRLLREDCSVVHGGMNGPGHINLFDPQALQELLRRAGYTAIDLDGHFADDPFELAAHVLGGSRGAYDMVSLGKEQMAVPARLQPLLNAVWPAIAEIERATLTAPILRVLACAGGQEGRFAAAVERLRERRRTAMTARLEALQPDADGAAREALAGAHRQWTALPPPHRWTVPSGIAIESRDDSGIAVLGDDSAFGYQLVSPQVAVTPGVPVTLYVPILELAGSTAVGVLGESGAWLVPATSHRELLRVDVGQNSFISVVVANLQADPDQRVRTRFRLQHGAVAQ